jgi:2-keto-4-pentenoate hydratase/2-oxohepta-3-ene-1,7-dioic acid hydratase in catechol pathway
MKLYTFEVDGRARVGAEHDGKLVDLAAAHAALIKASGRGAGTPLPSDMLSLIQAGAPALKEAQQALEFALGRSGDAGLSFDLKSVQVRAPIRRPGKILCSGINYHSHFKENPNAKLPTEPFFFSKVPSAVVGPGDPIRLPRQSQQVDYEVELAVVIGRTLTRASEAEIPGSLFGFMNLHDVSARDVQFKDSQITLGKNFDGFSPIGPFIVTADEYPHPERRKLRSYLNGEVMQDGTTEEWVFTLPRLISFLSHVMTLEPGDVISTGTPSGVGYFKNPQVFLKAGDRVAIEVEGLGRLENIIVAS